MAEPCARQSFGRFSAGSGSGVTVVTPRGGVISSRTTEANGTFWIDVDVGAAGDNAVVTDHHVGTAAAVYRAVVHGEPLISRVTTVTGDAFGERGNYEVRLEGQL